MSKNSQFGDGVPEVEHSVSGAESPGYTSYDKEVSRMPGRKPKPTALKVLEGNPGKGEINRHEPAPGKGMPKCPRWLLPEARKEWNRLAKKLNQMGVLTEIDQAAFAAYCQAWARWKEAQEAINECGAVYETDTGFRKSPWVTIANDNQRLMIQAASEFGLTPSSRSRIVAGSDSKSDMDEMEALLGA